MHKKIKNVIAFAILALLCLPTVCLSATTQKIALVVGNSRYDIAPLRNPANDARDMSAMLKKLGFKVTLETDATRRTMKKAINAFGKQLRRGGTGLFYYAGHGLQVQGRNYLIPVGAEIESESDVEYEAVDAGRVMGKMDDAGNGLNIIILDACRNNPFARSFRSSSSGLAKMDAPTGAILAYSTAPGSVAADGSGRNGLYTSKLLKHMATPNLKIETVFKRVRIDVSRASGKKQTPWESSSLMGDFYFYSDKPEDGRPARAVSVKKKTKRQNIDAEEETWKIVMTSSAIEDYEAFLAAYPESRFKTAAHLKMQQIKRKQNAQRITAPAAGYPTEKSRRIAALEKKTRSIPAKNAAANLAGYKKLLALAPDNPVYKRKVDYYSARLKEQTRQSSKKAKGGAADRVSDTRRTSDTAKKPSAGITMGALSAPKPEREDVQSRRRLAIFPWKPAKQYWNWAVLKAIENVLEENGLFKLTASYYDVDEGYQVSQGLRVRKITEKEILSVGKITYTDELWSKPSFLGNWEPRVDLITKIGKQFKVDAVLMCNLSIQAVDPPNGGVTMYLIKVSSGEKFHIKGYTMDFDEKGLKMSTQLGKELFSKLSR